MICPNCNNEIQHGLAFCPKCGTALNKDEETMVNSDEETQVGPQQRPQYHQPQYQQQYQQPQYQQPPYQQPYGVPNQGGNKNTGLIIACVVLGVILLGVIGVGAWMYIDNNQKEKEKIVQELKEKEEALKEAEEKGSDTVIVEKTKQVVVPAAAPAAPAYSEPANPSYVSIKGNSVNIRVSPSLSAGVMGLVYKGETLGFIADLGEWYEVDYYGSYGYVRKHHTTGKRIAVAY